MWAADTIVKLLDRMQNHKAKIHNPIELTDMLNTEHEHPKHLINCGKINFACLNVKNAADLALIQFKTFVRHTMSECMSLAITDRSGLSTTVNPKNNG